MPSRPLEGLLVADFSRVLAGPLATQTLADLGADVIKVERPELGDDTRAWGPSYFLAFNRGKRSIELDLKDAADLALARRLCGRADVVVESFRPGVMERLGLGPGTSPGAVRCSITAFGEHDLPGYDLLMQAVSGLMHVTGEEDGPPVRTGAAVIDLVCGLHAAVGILAALRDPARPAVRVSLMDAGLVALLSQASAHLVEGTEPRRTGNRHPSIAPYETFAAADGELALACGNDEMFTRLCAELALDELAADARFATNDARVAHRDELAETLGRVFAGGPVTEWVERLARAGVPAGPINDVAGAFAHAEALGLEPVWELDGVRSVRSPLRGLAAPTRRPPHLGEHSDDLRTWLEEEG